MKIWKFFRKIIKLFDYHFDNEYEPIGLEIFYRGIGLVGLISFIVLGIEYAIEVQTIKHFFFTTYLTCIELSLVFLFDFRCKLLNMMSCIPFVWFVCLNDFHFVLGLIQLSLILSKAPISKVETYISFLFLMSYVYIYDNLSRALKMFPIFLTTEGIKLMVFITLILSTLFIYEIKKKRGILK